VYVASLQGGTPRRLTTDHVRIHGLAWTPDGREVVFSSRRRSALSTLWRVRVSGSDPPSRVGGVLDESVWPSIARTSPEGEFRIAYQSVVQSVNLVQWEKGPGGGATPARVCPSSRFDWFAQLSPDGRRIAFSSTRSGSNNIWICEPGGQAHQVTFFDGAYMDSPRWSPDGNRLVFTSHENGSREVFLMDLETQGLRPLTHEASDEGRASFSRDGKWVYLRSNRSGRNEIWKMAATGGAARQITHTGAVEGFESPDGKLLYFTRDRPQLGVWSVPVEGGTEVKAVEGVRDGRWAVSLEGIHFVTVEPPFEIMTYRFDTKRVTRAYRLPKDATVWAGFTAAYDGSSVVWPQTVRESSDIAVLDGIR
jgi:Tol biopolymer transport system component